MFFPPVILYAETHYRFRWFFSFLRKPEPELIADAPLRLEPDAKLPILLLAKDADKFPCDLLRVTAHLTDGETERNMELLPSPLPLDTPFWWTVADVDVSDMTETISCDVEFEIEVRGKKRTYFNDNHRTSGKASLTVRKSGYALPSLPGLRQGETHAHSNHTSDQVEFGVPVKAAARLAGAMGLDYFCVTDHSYDLDDDPADYLTNDPAVPKWKTLREEIETLNAPGGAVTAIMGEEVSCRNAGGRNVHLLLFGNEEFIPGSGDSAERWLRTRSEKSVGEVLREKGESAGAFAAHPMEPVSAIQRLLLGRGTWGDADIRAEGLTGVQFANGKMDEGFARGTEAWIRLLLSGMHAVAIAGDDAHGNFNRFRQVGIPFVTIRENDDQRFGLMRTGIFSPSHSAEDLLASLRAGKCILTDGPVLNIRRTAEDKETALGATLRGRTQSLVIDAATTPEFGAFRSLRVMRGTVGDTREEIVPHGILPGTPEFSLTVPLTVEKPCFVRVEARTASRKGTGGGHFSFTNAVWLEP